MVKMRAVIRACQSGMLLRPAEDMRWLRLGGSVLLAVLLLACSTNSASHGVTVQPMLSAIWNSDW